MTTMQWHVIGQKHFTKLFIAAEDIKDKQFNFIYLIK